MKVHNSANNKISNRIIIYPRNQKKHIVRLYFWVGAIMMHLPSVRQSAMKSVFLLKLVKMGAHVILVFNHKSPLSSRNIGGIAFLKVLAR